MECDGRACRFFKLMFTYCDDNYLSLLSCICVLAVCTMKSCIYGVRKHGALRRCTVHSVKIKSQGPRDLTS